MPPEQHERAMGVIRALDLPKGAFTEVGRMDGYQLEHADGKRPYVFGMSKLGRGRGFSLESSIRRCRY